MWARGSVEVGLAVGLCICRFHPHPDPVQAGHMVELSSGIFRTRYRRNSYLLASFTHTRAQRAPVSLAGRGDRPGTSRAHGRTFVGDFPHALSTELVSAGEFHPHPRPEGTRLPRRERGLANPERPARPPGRHRPGRPGALWPALDLRAAPTESSRRVISCRSSWRQ